MSLSVVSHTIYWGFMFCICFVIYILKGEVAAPCPPVKYFTDRLCFFLSCVCYAFVRVCLYVPLSPAEKGLTSWLSFVVSVCEFVTFPLVFWVRFGT